jgi:hypothetical protein
VVDGNPECGGYLVFSAVQEGVVQMARVGGVRWLG